MFGPRIPQYHILHSPLYCSDPGKHTTYTSEKWVNVPLTAVTPGQSVMRSSTPVHATDRYNTDTSEPGLTLGCILEINHNRSFYRTLRPTGCLFLMFNQINKKARPPWNYLYLFCCLDNKGVDIKGIWIIQAIWNNWQYQLLHFNCTDQLEYLVKFSFAIATMVWRYLELLL